MIPDRPIRDTYNHFSTTTDINIEETMNRRNLKSIVAFLAICLLAPPNGTTAHEWIENTFQDFVDGTFGDGGANTYVSAQGKIQTVNRWDINDDGYIDLFFVNSHPLIEMLDMSIYWGNSQDFSIRNHTYVPVNGPMWVTPADLNKDGEQDLVVANFSNGTWTGMDSAIYWGVRKADGTYALDSRTHLPSQNCQKAVVADLNADGRDDIVMAFSGGFWEYRDPDQEGAPSRIYWQRQRGFARDDFTDLNTLGATDVAVADLNSDGTSDIVFANGEKGAPSYIYYGDANGTYANGNRAKLPAFQPHAVEIADVNGDGAADIVFANESGPVSLVYLNRNGEFSDRHRIELPTYTAKDCVVADFNKDGHADIFFTNHQHSLTGDANLANRLIHSYLYWGSEQGFSAENRQGLQTIGAWGTAAADLNRDGWVDLVVCNFQEHYSYEVPSFVYWNGPDGFSVSRRTPLYEHGAQGCSVADLNGDGHLDLAMTSMMGGSRGDYDPCWLYYGNAQGKYSTDKRISLPGREGYEQAMADLDDDGQVDLLLMNQGEVTRGANELYIYWNEDGSFDPWRLSGLPAYRGLGVQVADLDKDGYIDIVVSNYLSLKTEQQPDPGLTIYWGSAAGHVVTQRSELPIMRTRSPCIADVDGDGHLDIVCGQERMDKTTSTSASIFFGDGMRDYPEANRRYIEGALDTGTPEVADLNRDGHLDLVFAGNDEVKIYFGKDAQFALNRSQFVPIPSKTATVGDVNDDGWLDLVCPLYKQGGRRSLNSSVLLGGPQGFDVDRRIQLPTDGGTGAVVSDFNLDGRTDIFFWCHRHDGSHTEVGKFGDHATDSIIYFNSANGFSSDNRWGIPGKGVHYDIGVDLGHIRDRSFEFDYVSAPYQADGKRVAAVHWQATTPGNTAVRFQLRASTTRNGLEKAAWVGAEGKNSYFTQTPSLAEGPALSGNWFQYRAVLDTVNGATSPVLSQVRVTFTE